MSYSDGQEGEKGNSSESSSDDEHPPEPVRIEPASRDGHPVEPVCIELTSRGKHQVDRPVIIQLTSSRSDVQTPSSPRPGPSNESVIPVGVIASEEKMFPAREMRQRKKPLFLKDYDLLASSDESSTF